MDQNIRLDFYAIEDESTESVTMFEAKVQAGFPSPTQGMPGDTIDLNRALIIDRSLDPGDGDIAVCFIDGDFTVKRIVIKPDGVYLVPANKQFPAIHIAPESHFQIWGVVSHVIKHTRK